MNQKLPYYMMYPTPYLFDEGRKDEQDYAYLRSMYPEMAKKLLPFVEEECDRMEYDNSMLFDEYPDKLQLRLMSGRIWRKVMEKEEYTGEYQQIARDMVELLLYQEILRRRSTRRRDRQKKFW